MITELLTEYLVDDMTVNVGQATVDPFCRTLNRK